MPLAFPLTNKARREKNPYVSGLVLSARTSCTFNARDRSSHKREHFFANEIDS